MLDFANLELSQFFDALRERLPCRFAGREIHELAAQARDVLYCLLIGRKIGRIGRQQETAPAHLGVGKLVVELEVEKP